MSALGHSVSSKYILAEPCVLMGMSCTQMYCSVVHANCNMFVFVCVANGGIADSVSASAPKALHVVHQHKMEQSCYRLAG